MTVKKRSNKPQKVSETVRYYEAQEHLYFVVECHDKNTITQGNGGQAHTFRAPVLLIQRSMSRYAKPKKRTSAKRPKR